jgi:Domain of unknown function (DUF4783)
MQKIVQSRNTNIIGSCKFIVLLFIFLFAQNISFGNSIDVFAKCVLSKNMSAAKAYFSDNVQIGIDNQKNIVTQEKAALLLESFLKSNKILNFTIDNKGKSNSTSQQFAIGNLITKNKVFKIFITVDNADKITQVQIM